MQIFLVITIVAIAAGYLGWQFYSRFFLKNAKCDSCAVGKKAVGEAIK